VTQFVDATFRQCRAVAFGNILADPGLPVLRLLSSRCLSPNPSSTYLDIRPARPAFTHEVKSKRDQPYARYYDQNTIAVSALVSNIYFLDIVFFHVRNTHAI
jgi:hypothetical protein